MLFDEEKLNLAKTFSAAKEEFVNYKYKGNLDTLERFRYINAQLNTLIARIENLIDFFASGEGKLNSREGIEILENLEKQNQITSERLVFYSAVVHEVAKDQMEYRKNLLGAEMKKRVTATMEKLKVLEQQVGIERVNDREAMLNLIDRIERIRNRILTQEELIKRAFGISIEKRITELRAEIKTEFLKEPAETGAQ